jgi:DNA topoisomerase-1
MIAFARALPAIRRRVRRDLRRRRMPLEKLLATIVHLLETTLIRVGNEEYARENHSYGLTTLRNHHVRISRAEVHFTFRGKSGKRHQISIHDPQLARIVRRCQEIPGQELFTYEVEGGAVHKISSDDVNAYLRDISGSDFTAKDFRTWAGTVLAAIALREFPAVTQQRQLRKNVLRATEAVARMLGNTPAVCRKCYVHPAIVESYLSGTTIAAIQGRMARRLVRSRRYLSAEEAAVLELLQEGLKKASNGASALRRG